MQNKTNESNAEETDAQHYFLNRTKYGRKQPAAGSLQYYYYFSFGDVYLLTRQIPF